MKARNQALWVAGAAGIGAGLTYLYGTKQGRKLRRKMSHMARESSFRIVEGGRDIYDRSKEIAEDTRDLISRGTRVLYG